MRACARALHRLLEKVPSFYYNYPSLINLMVSVDVKHHVLLTYLLTDYNYVYIYVLCCNLYAV